MFSQSLRDNSSFPFRTQWEFEKKFFLSPDDRESIELIVVSDTLATFNFSTWINIEYCKMKHWQRIVSRLFIFPNR